MQYVRWAIDYHSGRTGRGGDLVYYDPWRRDKIDESLARMGADETRILPDYLESGWVHPKRTLKGRRVTTRVIITPIMGGITLNSTRGKLRHIKVTPPWVKMILRDHRRLRLWRQMTQPLFAASSRMRVLTKRRRTDEAGGDAGICLWALNALNNIEVFFNF